MIITRNGFPVKPTWSTVIHWGSAQHGALHLSVFAIGTDIVAQVLDHPGEGFVDDQSEEILFRQGFGGRDLPPFYSVRLKIWSGTTGSLTTGTADVTLHD